MTRITKSGFTLTELMLTVVIVGIMGGLTIATVVGMRYKDALTRATQQVYDDLILIRSQAVSTSKTHRIRFISDTSWVLEYYNTDLSTPAWVEKSSTRTMPGSTNLMSGSLTNAGSNLESTSRGIFQFQNGATGSPYVSIETQGVTQTKSIYVYTGGAIEIQTQ